MNPCALLGPGRINLPLSLRIPRSSAPWAPAQQLVILNDKHDWPFAGVFVASGPASLCVRQIVRGPALRASRAARLEPIGLLHDEMNRARTTPIR